MDLSGYTWRWWLNLLLGALSVAAVIANIIVTTVPNGAWLGLTDVQWHYVLLVSTAVTAINALLNHTPLVTQPPTTSRLQVENQVAEIRKAA